jgi:hypothetical protein
MQLQNSHLNAFLPRQTNQFPNPSQTREQFTAWVHSLGGMASFNHPFGANVSLDPNQAHQDQLVIETASDLLAAGVYGCDMIEAYTYRTCDLAHHLQLWDILTANGYNLLGIGTTDSHGGPWDEDYNYFVTWVWATGPDEDSLLAGMQSRALYFGSSFRFNEASLNYTAGGVSMGQVTTVNSNLATLNLQIAGFQPNWERRLRQYLVQPGLEIVNVVGTPQQPWIVLDGDTVDLDTSRSSFIRVEIWDTTDGKPVAFGQTIVLNREMRN